VAQQLLDAAAHSSVLVAEKEAVAKEGAAKDAQIKALADELAASKAGFDKEARDFKCADIF